MKIRLKHISLAMIVLITVILSACNGDNKPSDLNDNNTGKVTSDIYITETEDIFKKINLNGEEIRVFYFSDEDRNNYQVIGKENSGDVLYDSIYERNKTIEERLNIEFKFIPSASTAWQEVKEEFQKVLLAGSDEYDLIITSGNTTIQGGLNNYFYDMSDKPYLDFSQPWWWDNAMQELSIDTKTRNFLIGDFLTSNYLRAGALFYNKNIYSDFFNNPDELYNHVINGEWTIDKLISYAKQVFVDVNGNGVSDAEDIFAMKVFGNEVVNHFIYATDFKPYSRDAEGYPVITINNEQTITLIEKLRTLFAEPNVLRNNDSTAFAKGETFINFARGEMLFYPARLLAAVSPALRAMEADYGILTYPKLDENQEKYMTLIHNSSDQAGVPITSTKVDTVAAVLEAWCYESYMNTTEVFYDITLKTKYTRDDISSKVIDIVKDGAVKNLVYEYQSTLGIGGLVNLAVVGLTNNFVSQYTASETQMNTKLMNLIDTLTSGQ